MKVHVIRDSGFPIEQYEQVMQELESTSGLISFVRQTVEVLEPGELPLIIDSTLLIDNEGELVKQKSYSQKYRWSYFFYQCEDYRDTCKITKEDFIVLLTPRSNDYNYLAAFDDDVRSVFVKTSEWSAYLECSPVYPIAFTIMSQVLQKLYFKNMYRRSHEGHQPAEGCINDFCFHKKEVIFKFRTADVCMPCLEDMLSAGIPQEYFLQAFSLFEKMRSEMLFKQRRKFIVEQRKIYITLTKEGGQGITVRLSEIDKEINLNPKESALYLFYLTSTKGVPYAHLHYDDHFKKLLALYKGICEGSSKGQDSKIRRVIKTLVDPENKQNRDSDLSHMRKKFKATLGSEVAKQYYINGLEKDKDLQKGIRLSRSLVSYDDNVKKYILGNYAPTDSVQFTT
jgi:hypothetical protein